MIIGIGIDIVSVPRLREIISRTPKFLDRLVSLGAKSDSPIESLAGFFVAYEALYKALPYVSRVEIESFRLIHNKDGSPSFQFPPEGSIGTNSQQKEIHVSITHDLEYAAAIVVIEASNHKLSH